MAALPAGQLHRVVPRRLPRGNVRLDLFYRTGYGDNEVVQTIRCPVS